MLFSFLSCFVYIGYSQTTISTIAKTSLVTIEMPTNAHPRIKYAVELLQKSLDKYGYKTIVDSGDFHLASEGILLVVGTKNMPLTSNTRKALSLSNDTLSQKEGFVLRSAKNTILIESVDTSGVLYVSMAIVDSLKLNGHFPYTIDTCVRLSAYGHAGLLCFYHFFEQIFG